MLPGLVAATNVPPAGHDAVAIAFPVRADVHQHGARAESPRARPAGVSQRSPAAPGDERASRRDDGNIAERITRGLRTLTTGPSANR
jgi:hypothetical protein